MTRDKLKPCPFCGSKKLGLFQVCSNITQFRIVCKNNKNKTGWGHPHVEGPLAETKAEAIAAWNKRAGEKNE